VKWAVGFLAAFGVLGAIGTNVVNEIFPDVAEKVSGGGSIGISVREDPHGGSDGFTAATSSPAGLDAKLRQASDCDSLFSAAKAAGAVDVGQSIHDLVLEGRTHRDVAIVDVRARILKRQPPLAGARISCQSAGAVEAIGMYFNLDETAPVARKITGYHEVQDEPYFGQGNVVSLTEGEIQPLQVITEVRRDYVEWEIDVELIIDGEEEEVTIDNNGEPFRITGERRKRDYARYFEWVWYEQPQYLYTSDQPKM
jgi:hypothetical protein